MIYAYLYRNDETMDSKHHISIPEFNLSYPSHIHENYIDLYCKTETAVLVTA
jgi:hypothetical protein